MPLAWKYFLALMCHMLECEIGLEHREQFLPKQREETQLQDLTELQIIAWHNVEDDNGDVIRIHAAL